MLCDVCYDEIGKIIKFDLGLILNIIYSRLYKFIVSQNILSDSQFGFCSGHSSIHALHYSIDIIKDAHKNKKHVLGIFIDCFGHNITPTTFCNYFSLYSSYVAY